MTTKELLIKYLKLKKINPTSAYQLFLENETNERLVSLIRTYDNFAQFTKEFIEEGGDILDKKSYREYLDKRFEKE